jgi:hypothetical protein
MAQRLCSEFLDCIITHFKIADSVLPFRFNLDIQYSQMHFFETVNDTEIKTQKFILILQLEWWGILCTFSGYKILLVYEILIYLTGFTVTCKSVRNQ